MPRPIYSPATLRVGLKPFRLHFYTALRSTNDHAAALRRRGELFAPAVVLTPHQIAGRGRGDNRWFSNSGAITATFAFPVEAHLAPNHLPLIAGLAVRAAAQEIIDHAFAAGDGAKNHPGRRATTTVELKWPNDVMHRGRKLAGLLCERIDKVDLIGIGLNVNLIAADAPLALKDKVTSLREITARPLDLNDVLIVLAHHLRRFITSRHEHSFAWFLQEYDEHHVLRGRRITIAPEGDDPPLSGRCEGLDSAGRLLVRRRGELHRIINGHVIEY